MKGKEEAVGQVEKMAGKADEAVTEVTERVQEAATEFKVALDGSLKAVNRSLKEKPFTTLAVAAMIGFALGAIWKT